MRGNLVMIFLVLGLLALGTLTYVLQRNNVNVITDSVSGGVSGGGSSNGDSGGGSGGGSTEYYQNSFAITITYSGKITSLINKGYMDTSYSTPSIIWEGDVKTAFQETYNTYKLVITVSSGGKTIAKSATTVTIYSFAGQDAEKTLYFWVVGITEGYYNLKAELYSTYDGSLIATFELNFNIA